MIRHKLLEKDYLEKLETKSRRLKGSFSTLSGFKELDYSKIKDEYLKLTSTVISNFLPTLDTDLTAMKP
jgi:hypothetical protein